MRVAINIVTRGRPELALHTLGKVTEAIRGRDTSIMVSLDDDDWHSIEEFDGYLKRDFGVSVSVRPREDDLGSKYNRVTEIDADIYVPMVDYVYPVTQGFDLRIAEAAELFPDGIGIVCNHMANASFPYSQAITRGLVEKQGFMWPTHFPYWFGDHWIDDIARLIDRLSFADFHVEVLQRPSGTQEYREPDFWSALFDAGMGERRRIARKIIDSDDFHELGWRKEMLRRHWPLIAYRSRWVNDNVRDQGKHIRSTAFDERYFRLREKGHALMREWATRDQQERDSHSC